jgi:hypothetical protein
MPRICWDAVVAIVCFLVVIGALVILGALIVHESRRNLDAHRQCAVARGRMEARQIGIIRRLDAIEREYMQGK